MLDKLLHGQMPAYELRKVWEDHAAKFPKGSLRMRFSDNHDERRAIARFGEKGAIAPQALVFTLDGVPLVYNGTESGDTTESGALALFEKRPIFWQFAERRCQLCSTCRERGNCRRDKHVEHAVLRFS